MGGTVVMIVILALIPVAIVMSGVLIAALFGTALTRDRDAAYHDTEHLAISRTDPYSGS